MDAPVTTKVIIGAPVYGPDGVQVGTIEELLIDPLTGRIAGAGVAHGGFMGLGESEEPVPWDLLRWDGALEGYVTGVPIADDEAEAPAGLSPA